MAMASSPTTVEEFLELGQKSGLLDPQGLDAYLEQQRAADALPDAPTSLAQQMVRDGLLTQFQADQLLEGRWRGFLIAGKYRLLDCLGTGGMGTVLLCEHAVMRRRVALKVLPNAKTDDSSMLDRFRREARAAAQLRHPNIVHAYDFDSDGKVHFLVMEYIDGSSLDRLVKQEGPLDVARAARYVAAVASGLQHAHEAGLVHRDIKPGNILVDRQDTVKILDMGLARFFDDEDGLTREHDSNVIMGTADFLAPEQAVDSHAVDIRADIYSLGVTFYFLLAGQGPFGQGSVAQKLLWHLMREPRPIRETRPDVPEELAAVLHKMMAKDRDERYQTPAEVVAALAPWAQIPDAPPSSGRLPKISLPPATPVGGSGGTDRTPLPRALAGRVAPPPSSRTSIPPPPLSREPGSGVRPTEGAEAPPRERVRAERPDEPRPDAVRHPRGRSRYVHRPATGLWLWVAVGVPSLVVLVAVVVAVLAVATDHGTLVVEMPRNGIQMTIQGGGQEVVVNGVQGRQNVVLKSGRYHIQPGRGWEKVVVTPSEFTIRRGEEVTVSVWELGASSNSPKP
jgi:serine/threonine protein kinase